MNKDLKEIHTDTTDYNAAPAQEEPFDIHLAASLLIEKIQQSGYKFVQMEGANKIGILFYDDSVPKDKKVCAIELIDKGMSFIVGGVYKDNEGKYRIRKSRNRVVSSYRQVFNMSDSSKSGTINNPDYIDTLFRRVATVYTEAEDIIISGFYKDNFIDAVKNIKATQESVYDNVLKIAKTEKCNSLILSGGDGKGVAYFPENRDGIPVPVYAVFVGKTRLDIGFIINYNGTAIFWKAESCNLKDYSEATYGELRARAQSMIAEMGNMTAEMNHNIPLPRKELTFDDPLEIVENYNLIHKKIVAAKAYDAS